MDADIKKDKDNKIFSPSFLKECCYKCGIKYKNEYYLTKKQLAGLFEVDEKTIDWHIEDCIDELQKNGYKILNSEEIEYLKNLNNININADNKKVEIFSFQAILNLSMFMFSVPNASIVRENLLKIVMQNVSNANSSLFEADFDCNKNSKERGEISSFLENKTYNDKNIKNYIFKSIFLKKADGYQKMLNIKFQDSIRAAMNLEITKLIDKYYDAFFDDIKELSQKENSLISEDRFKGLLKDSLSNKKYEPLINEIKSLFTNRNIIFMNAFYKKIQDFPNSVKDENVNEYVEKKCKKIQDKFLKDENLQILIDLQNR